MASFQATLLDRFLRMMNLTNVSPGVAPESVRERLNALCMRAAGDVHGIDIQKLTVAGLPAEWLRPKERSPKSASVTVSPSDAEPNDRRVMLYLHGGGYVLGSLDTHRATVARMAVAGNTETLMINYRLAPEHPYPAALEDAEAAYLWLMEQGIPAKSIAIGGDSAGGGLALALMMLLRDKRLPMPAAAVLLSPWTDLAFTGMSHLTRKGNDPVIALEGAMLAARHYLNGALPTDPYVSPLYGDFTGLPPMLIHVGSNEILLDDSTRVAEKARAAGVEVNFKLWPDMPHVFHGFQFLPEAKEAAEEIGAYLEANVPNANAQKQTAPEQRSWLGFGKAVLNRSGLQHALEQLPAKIGLPKSRSRTM